MAATAPVVLGCTADLPSSDESTASEPVPPFVGDWPEVELLHLADSGSALDFAGVLDLVVTAKPGISMSDADQFSIGTTSTVVGAATGPGGEVCAVAVDTVSQAVATSCETVDGEGSPVWLTTESVSMVVNVPAGAKVATLAERYQLVHHGVAAFAVDDGPNGNLKLFDFLGNAQ